MYWLCLREWNRGDYIESMDTTIELKHGFMDWITARRNRIGKAMAMTALVFTVACAPSTVNGGNRVSTEPMPSGTQGESSPLPTSGDCEPFTVRGQNFIDPIGASVRGRATIKSEKVGGIGGNEIVTVTGWKKSGEIPYPENPDPYKGDIWYEVSNSAGYYKDGDNNIVWINGAGVRKGYSSYKSHNGDPAPLDPACEITSAVE